MPSFDQIFAVRDKLAIRHLFAVSFVILHKWQLVQIGHLVSEQIVELTVLDVFLQVLHRVVSIKFLTGFFECTIWRNVSIFWQQQIHVVIQCFDHFFADVVAEKSKRVDCIDEMLKIEISDNVHIRHLSPKTNTHIHCFFWMLLWDPNFYLINKMRCQNIAWKRIEPSSHGARA